MATGLDFASIVQLAPRYVAAISIACGIVLFVPDTAVTNLGLADFKKTVHPWLSGAFVLSSSLLFVHWIILVWRWLLTMRHAAAERKSQYQRLHKLTADKQKLLRPFVADRTRTQRFAITDGLVGGLESAGVIYKSAGLGKNLTWEYNIQPWAYDYLVEHSELVDAEAQQADAHEPPPRVSV